MTQSIRRESIRVSAPSLASAQAAEKVPGRSRTRPTSNVTRPAVVDSRLARDPLQAFVGTWILVEGQGPLSMTIRRDGQRLSISEGAGDEARDLGAYTFKGGVIERVSSTVQRGALGMDVEKRDTFRLSLGSDSLFVENRHESLNRSFLWFGDFVPNEVPHDVRSLCGLATYIRAQS